MNNYKPLIQYRFSVLLSSRYSTACGYRKYEEVDVVAHSLPQARRRLQKILQGSGGQIVRYLEPMVPEKPRI